MRLVFYDKNNVRGNTSWILITFFRESYLRATLPARFYVDRQHLILHSTWLVVRVQYFPKILPIVETDETKKDKKLKWQKKTKEGNPILRQLRRLEGWVVRTTLITSTELHAYLVIFIFLVHPLYISSKETWSSCCTVGSWRWQRPWVAPFIPKGMSPTKQFKDAVNTLNSIIANFTA